MNQYSRAAFSSYVRIYLILFTLPATAFALSQNTRNCIRMLAWIGFNLMAVSLIAFGIGKFNQRIKRLDWNVTTLQSIVILFTSAIAAMAPAILGDSPRDYLVTGGRIAFYGLIPALLAGVFHKGKIEWIENQQRALSNDD